MCKASVVILALSLVLGGLYGGPRHAEAQEGYGEDIIFTKPVKGVLFSHKTHVEDTGLDCNVCHDKLFQMSALTAQEGSDFNHKSFKAGKYCGACHDGKMGFAMDAQCAKCHTGVKGLKKAEKKGSKK
jgi:c(7)-type cytochrome triheme protein